MRIVAVAVADACDASRSARPHKQGSSREKTTAILLEFDCRIDSPDNSDPSWLNVLRVQGYALEQLYAHFAGEDKNGQFHFCELN